MYDAMGNTESPSASDGTVRCCEKGVLFHVGLNLGRTTRLLRNGPGRLGKAVGRAIVCSAQKICSLAGGRAPNQRAAQEKEEGVPATTGLPDNDAASASAFDAGRSTNDDNDGLAVDMDLKNLEDLVGKRKRDE